MIKHTAIDPEVQARRDAATIALKHKMHRLWHQIRKIEVCDTLRCEHPWYPA